MKFAWPPREDAMRRRGVRVPDVDPLLVAIPVVRVMSYGRGHAPAPPRPRFGPDRHADRASGTVLQCSPAGGLGSRLRTGARAHATAGRARCSAAGSSRTHGLKRAPGGRSTGQPGHDPVGVRDARTPLSGAWSPQRWAAAPRHHCDFLIIEKPQAGRRSSSPQAAAPERLISPPEPCREHSFRTQRPEDG